MDKEKEGKTVRFSIRLPKEYHSYLKEVSDATRGIDFVSMNTFIANAIKEYIERRAEEPWN